MKGLDTYVRYYQSSARFSEASRRQTRNIGLKTCITSYVNANGLKKHSSTS